MVFQEHNEKHGACSVSNIKMFDGRSFTKVSQHGIDMFKGHNTKDVYDILKAASPRHMEAAHGQYGRVALGAPFDVLGGLLKSCACLNNGKFLPIWHDWYIYDSDECKKPIKTHMLRTYCVNKSDMWDHDEVNSNATTVSMICVLGGAEVKSGVFMTYSVVNPEKHDCWLKDDGNENYQTIPSCYDKNEVEQGVRQVQLQAGKWVVQKATAFRPEHFLEITKPACVIHLCCVQGEKGATRNPFGSIPRTSTKLIEQRVTKDNRHESKLRTALGRLTKNDKKEMKKTLEDLLVQSRQLYTVIPETEGYENEMAKCSLLRECECGCQQQQSAQQGQNTFQDMCMRAIRNQQRQLDRQEEDAKQRKRLHNTQRRELEQLEEKVRRRDRFYVANVDDAAYDNEQEMQQRRKIVQELTNRISAKHLPELTHIQNENMCSIMHEPLGSYNGAPTEIRGVLCGNTVQFYNQRGILAWIVKQAGGDWNLERVMYDGAIGFKFMNACEYSRQPSDPRTNMSISVRSAEEMASALAQRLGEAQLQQLKRSSPWLQDIMRFANPETRPPASKSRRRTRSSSGAESVVEEMMNWRQICKKNVCLFAQGELSDHMGSALCGYLEPANALAMTWLLHAPKMQSMSESILKLTNKCEQTIEENKKSVLAQYLESS